MVLKERAVDPFPDIRMDGVCYGFAEFAPPWCVVVPRSDHAHLYVVRAGECWFESSEGSPDPIHVRAGSVVGVAGGQEVVWRDSLETPIAKHESLFPMHGFDAEQPAVRKGASVTRFMVGRVARSSNLLIAMLPPFIYASPEVRGSLDRLNQTLQLIEVEMRLESGSEVGPQSIDRRLPSIARSPARPVRPREGIGCKCGAKPERAANGVPARPVEPANAAAAMALSTVAAATATLRQMNSSESASTHRRLLRPE